MSEREIFCARIWSRARAMDDGGGVARGGIARVAVVAVGRVARPRGVPRGAGEAEVLDDGERREQRVALRAVADAPRAGGDADAPARRGKVPRGDAERRRLPAPVDPEQTEALPGGDAQP